MKKLLFIGLFFLSYSAFACSCIYSEFGFADYMNASYILEGKIVEITDDEATYEKIITFKVRRKIKGETPETVEIRTAKDSAACGVNVKENDKWLFFVSVYNGKMHVDSCGKHVRYNRRQGELRRQKKKRCQLKKKMIKQMKEFEKPSYNEQ